FQFLGDLALFLNYKKTIITCHDIYNFLQRKSLKNPIFTQKYALMGLKKCRIIIAISNFTKNELIDKLKIPEDKIVVIKNAINREMFKQIPKNKISEIKPLFPNYKKILYVGSEAERKNIITLFKAFYLIKRRSKKFKLIRVGPSTHSHVIKSLGLEKDVVYLKNITNQRLTEIYNLCDLFITPSLYEGFGFPGIEAASCGTPVICSEIPVFREIYQDFPIYFPPKDYKTLAKIILESIDNEVLKNEMSMKGINTVKAYSWKDSAEKYLKLNKFILDNQ
ncbi:MAG: glycosyltransferase family 4 protein, partial [Promethearchaeota archaeon]